MQGRGYPAPCNVNMNLANKLTISRMILAGVFILFLFVRGAGAKFFAFAIFLDLNCCLNYKIRGVVLTFSGIKNNFSREDDTGQSNRVAGKMEGSEASWD